MATSTSTDADPSARDYFRAALDVFGRDPVLAAWKIIGDLASAMLRPIAFFWVTMIVAVGLGAGGYRGGGLDPLLATIDRVDAPVAVGGMIGFAATFWLVGLTLDSVVSGGLYRAVADDLGDGGDGGTGRLLGAIGRGFPKMFVLQFVGAAAELILVLLGLSVAIAIGTPFLGEIETAAWGTFGQALFIAVPAFLFFAFAALVRLVFEVAAAPLFVEDATVGEAVADGARFLIAKLAQVYRLVVFAASLLLVPLLVYWGWLITANLFGLDSPLAPLFTAGRVAGYVVLYTGMSLIGALFTAAVFAYYGAQTDHYVVRAEDADAEEDGEATTQSEPSYDETTRIADLLPDEPDAIVDFSDVPELEPENESKE